MGVSISKKNQALHLTENINGNVYRLPRQTNNDYDIFILKFICLLNSCEQIVIFWWLVILI